MSLDPFRIAANSSHEANSTVGESFNASLLIPFINLSINVRRS